MILVFLFLTYFTLLIPSSQSIPLSHPSPLANTSLFSMSVNPFLFHR